MAEPKVPNREFTNQVIEEGGETLNLCFQCGTCTGSCPSGRHTVFRTRKLIRRAQLGLKEDVLPSDDLWYCTTCYTCYERCPRGVEIPDIILALRNMAVREGYMAEDHKRVAKFLCKTGHMVPLTDKYKAIRSELGLKESPDTVLTNEKALDQMKKIIEATGFDELVGAGGD